MLFSGREEVMGRELTDPVDELQAAKNCSYWSTANKVNPHNRANYYKTTLDVSEGEGRVLKAKNKNSHDSYCVRNVSLFDSVTRLLKAYLLE